MRFGGKLGYINSGCISKSATKAEDTLKRLRSVHLYHVSYIIDLGLVLNRDIKI